MSKLKENEVKCKGCEKIIDTDHDWFTTGINGKDEYCESCEQCEWEYACTVVTSHQGDVKSYLWCETFGFRDKEDYEEASPNGVKAFKYVRTDGWRGYWDVVPAKGYKILAGGWSTGRWSDVEYKHAFNDFCEGIMGGEIGCPFEITTAFGLTSNVFSVSSNLIIKRSEASKFKKWVEANMDVTVEDLQYALR